MNHPNHASHGHGATRGRIGVVLILTAVYAATEFAGGLWSHSLALLADSGHMLTDVLALGVALYCATLALRPPDLRKTFGYKRVEILGALFNGVLLLAIAGTIAVEAWERWNRPQEINVPLMAGIAAGGLLVNLIAAFLLHGGRSNINVRAAYYHVLGDLLGSLGALAAAAAIAVFGWNRADTLASVIIAAILVGGAIRLLKDAVHVLLEGAPHHLDIEQICSALLDLPGVREVHDMHLWSLGGTEPLLSAHLVVDFAGNSDRILRQATETLRDRFGIDHTTLQIEPADFNIGGEVVTAIRDRT